MDVRGTPRSPAVDLAGTKLFAWHGLSCRIPEGWDPTSVTGTDREGYFSFDDERARRLEIKYARARRWRQPALEKTLEYYFHTVQKKLKKGMAFDVEYDVKLIGAERIPSSYEYRTYGWTSDFVARGIIWKCPVCRRVVIAQALAVPNRVNYREMADVLTSVRCHADGDAQVWAAFEFAVEVPKRFLLDLYRLQAGLISLSFIGRNERLVVDRIGMAHAVLKHTPMDHYVANIHYKKLRRRRLRFVEEPWRGHAGFRIEGERLRLRYLLPGIGRIFLRWSKKDHIGGRLWHCPAANRLFVVRAEGKGARELADSIAATIVCHAGNGSNE